MTVIAFEDIKDLSNSEFYKAMGLPSHITWEDYCLSRNTMLHPMLFFMTLGPSSRSLFQKSSIFFRDLVITEQRSKDIVQRMTCAHRSYMYDENINTNFINMVVDYVNRNYDGHIKEVYDSHSKLTHARFRAIDSCLNFVEDCGYSLSFSEEIINDVCFIKLKYSDI